MNYLQIREKLSGYKVGIAGCGGLGSNCAAALTRVGIGELLIVDFDKVEECNLNRQYYFYHQIGMDKAAALHENLMMIGSQTKIKPLVLRLNPENILDIFNGCDIVVEAFDSAEQKAMLIECLLGKGKGFKVVSGVGMAGWGMTGQLKVKTYDNLIICGDMKTEASENLPPIAPRVGIVANMQANIVLELLLGKM
jgi:sulfur carrier protein ThiS adenylyltransferase